MTECKIQCNLTIVKSTNNGREILGDTVRSSFNIYWINEMAANSYSGYWRASSMLSKNRFRFRKRENIDDILKKSISFSVLFKKSSILCAKMISLKLRLITRVLITCFAPFDFIEKKKKNRFAGELIRMRIRRICPFTLFADFI